MSSPDKPTTSSSSAFTLPFALPSLTKTFLSIFGLLFALSLVITPVYPNSTFNTTNSKPIQVTIDGQSQLSIPANRAILKLDVTASGPSQAKVADDLRKAIDEALSLLRPHSNSHHTDTTKIGSQEDSDSDSDTPFTPISSISVNTFTTHSHTHPSLLGDKQTHSSSASISATFHSPPPPSSPSTTPLTPPPSFTTLSHILTNLTKQPHITISSLQWTLDDPTKKSLLATVRTAAMQEAIDKVRAYASPLLGDNLMIRAIKFSEGRGSKYHYNDDDLILRSTAQYRRMWVNRHSEGERGGDEDAEEVEYGEVIGLEPRVLTIKSEVEGEFEVWVPFDDPSSGSLWRWLRWCHIEISALGAKVMLRR